MEEKQKKKVKVWQIVLIILGGLFFWGLIIGIFSGNETNAEESYSSNPKTNTIEEEYISKSLDDLYLIFVSSSSELTDLQKEKQFENYDGKLIKSEGIVSKIDNVMMSSDIVVGIMSPENPYLREATLYFDSSYEDELLNYNEYDEISFKGKITDYNSLLGIIVQDAELI